MNSLGSNSEVQRELNELSPALARLRQGQQKESSIPDQAALQNLAKKALKKFEESIVVATEQPVAPSSLRVAHRRRIVFAAAAVLLFALCAGILWSNDSTSPDSMALAASTDFNLSDDDLFTASSDPIAYLISNEIDLYIPEDEVYSATELVLFDWADDGIVENELSEEALRGAVW